MGEAKGVTSRFGPPNFLFFLIDKIKNIETLHVELAELKNEISCQL